MQSQRPLISGERLAEASFAFQRRQASRRQLRKIIPLSIRCGLRVGFQLTLDAWDLCRGRNRDLVPPRWRNFAGDGDFEKSGDEFLDYFVRLAGLGPSHRVLEVGCGIGRMARPLTRYLMGRYEGFDIVPAGIRWCEKNITARHPNFHFTLADLRNREYNPGGRQRAAEYRFPYSDAQFDFAILTSVFTHLPFAETDHYLRELARVLAPGSRCLATFFLLNEQSRALLNRGASSIDFCYALDRAWTSNPDAPETAIAYEESVLRQQLVEANGFALRSLHYGSWCGRDRYLSYQDVVVLEKNCTDQERS
jgi:SAM-dependent methyltransferase